MDLKLNTKPMWKEKNNITKFDKNIYTKIPNKTLTLSEFLTNDILQFKIWSSQKKNHVKRTHQ